jgi:cell division protein FtsI (penicillin-binding protein 3)
VLPQPPRPRTRSPRQRRQVRALRGTSLVRLRIGFLIIAMVVSVFAARLFELQGVDARAYVAKARAEGVVTVTLPATRGSITDRNGVPLADSADGLMLVADPKVTARNAGPIATILARRLGVDYFDVLTRLRKPYGHFQYLARRVPATEARSVLKEIEDHHYKGVDVRRDPVRTYPAKDVAANLVGFMNEAGQAGEGAELMFDRLLAGKDGRATYEVGGGNRIPLGDNSTVQPHSGHDLTLTIDRDVQWFTQRVLRDAVQGSRAKTGSAVVMDTHTGELLALADYPTFDANQPTLSPKADLGSRALRNVYEPGSVEKVLTSSSLIDAGKVTPNTRITVPPQLVVQDRVIHDWFVHPTLHLTLTGVIAKSSNIGTALADREFSPQELYGYLRKFGLGQRTGVVDPNSESPGVLNDWHSWSQINQDTIAFGQGVAVNTVQMAAAINAVANDGVYVSPSLVKGAVRTTAGHLIGSATSTEHRVISKHAAHLTAQMMEAVTNHDTGTAGGAAVEGYRVAGKTGTAQRVGSKCRCYDGTFTVSFAGFAPADKPRFLVYVVVDDPKNGGGGGSIGAPAFHKIMSYLLQKYAVPPTGTTPPTPRIEW